MMGLPVAESGGFEATPGLRLACYSLAMKVRSPSERLGPTKFGSRMVEREAGAANRFRLDDLS